MKKWLFDTPGLAIFTILGISLSFLANYVLETLVKQPFLEMIIYWLGTLTGLVAFASHYSDSFEEMVQALKPNRYSIEICGLVLFVPILITLAALTNGYASNEKMAGILVAAYAVFYLTGCFAGKGIVVFYRNWIKDSKKGAQVAH